MPRDDHDQIDALNRFLDEAVGNQRVGPSRWMLDSTFVEVEQRLRERDDVPSPDPVFVRRLEGSLMTTASLGGRSTRAPTLASTVHELVLPPAIRVANRRPAQSRPRISFGRLAAALLVATAIAGYFAFRSVPPDDHRGTTVPAPEFAGPGTPESISPSECTVDPRTVEVVLGKIAAQPWAGTPEAESFTPHTLPPDLPNGPAADTETIAAVSATWHEYWACQFSGERLRLFALMSDERLADLLGSLSGYELAVFLTESVPPAPEPYYLPYSLRDFRVLPDGRVGALADFRLGFGNPEYEGRHHVIFIRGGDRWLVDETHILNNS